MLLALKMRCNSQYSSRLVQYTLNFLGVAAFIEESIMKERTGSICAALVTHADK